MKKFLLIIATFCLCFSLSNCKKDNPKFSSPSWSFDAIGKYPATMTAVVQLPDYLKMGLKVNDKMGAFINDECRGTGELIKLDSVSAFFVMIHGSASENGTIIFKYYASRNSHIYSSKDTLNFGVDENYGTADNPKALNLKVVR